MITPEKTALRAAIFDLDGTVAFTLPDLLTAINKMLESYSFATIDAPALMRCINFGGREMVRRAICESGSKAPDEEMLDEAFARYRKAYAGHTVDQTAPYDGIPELLKNLRLCGIKTALITNKDSVFVKPIIDSLFPGDFDIYMGYDGSFPHKPDPAGVNSLMERLSIKPEETAYIGDSPVDMETAKNCGAHAFWVSWGYAGAESVSHCPGAVTVNSADELIGLIK